jgi:hypothetical protein
VFITTLFRGGQRLGVPNPFASWWEPDLKVNDIVKRGSMGFHFNDWDGFSDPSPLRDEWLEPLRKMFWTAQDHSRTYSVNRRKGAGAIWTTEQVETCDGMITFDSFMTKLV